MMADTDLLKIHIWLPLSMF